jgi:hypothetical protein
MSNGGEPLMATGDGVTPDTRPLEEDLAAHLLCADREADFGLSFEEAHTSAAPSFAAAGDATDERDLHLVRETLIPTGDGCDRIVATLPPASPELSGEELAWALGQPTAISAEAEAAPAARRNRRAALRYAAFARASVRRIEAEQDIDVQVDETVQLRNLSAGGVSSLHARPLKPGDTFWITLRSPDARAASLARTIERRCTVLRCEPGGTGRAMFSVAARFLA